MSRRTAIADAAIEIIAREGLRGLTHRAVDREVSLPAGTTSNYARTRQELIDLVVGRMAEHTAVDVAPSTEPPATIRGAVDVLVDLFELALAREVETRARLALSVELASDPRLHGALNDASTTRRDLLRLGQDLLAGLGVADPAARAVDVVGLLNGLVYDRVAGGGLHGRPVDVRNVLTAWLTGIGSAR